MRISIFLIGCIVSMLQAQSFPLTNRAVLDSLLDPVILKSVSATNLKDLDISVQTDSIVTPVERYIIYRFEDTFRRHEANILPVNTRSDTGILLNLYIPEAQIQYLKRFTRRFLGKTWILREVSLELDIKIIQISENKLMFSESYKQSFKDEFPFAALNEVERGFSQHHPDIPPLKGVRSWLEPFLLISSIGAVIYLFFAIRS